ncbi:unnamed protein product [Malus baccata var. baccata]
MEKEMKLSKFKRICVFCGSSPGNKSSYKEAAIELGEELVSKNIDLVYGGGSVGLMGLISQAVYDGGRHVIGVIPKTLMPREITGDTVGEVKAVADMHQRKAEMAKHSDAFIALPGWYITWHVHTHTHCIHFIPKHLNNITYIFMVYSKFP